MCAPQRDHSPIAVEFIDDVHAGLAVLAEPAIGLGIDHVRWRLERYVRAWDARTSDILASTGENGYKNQGDTEKKEKTRLQ